MKKVILLGILLALLPMVYANEIVVDVCDPQRGITCNDGDVYWVNSCGEPYELKEECGTGICRGNACAPDTCSIGGEILQRGDNFCGMSHYRLDDYPTILVCNGYSGVGIVERCIEEGAYCEDAQCKQPVVEPPVIEPEPQQCVCNLEGYATEEMIPDVSNFATIDMIPDISEFEANQQQIIQIHNQMNTGFQTQLNSFVGRLDSIENDGQCTCNTTEIETMVDNLAGAFSQSLGEIDDIETRLDNHLILFEDFQNDSVRMFGFQGDAINKLENEKVNRIELFQFFEKFGFELAFVIDEIKEAIEENTEDMGRLESRIEIQSEEITFQKNQLLSFHTQLNQQRDKLTEFENHEHKTAFPNYFEYMGSSDKRKMLCGYMEGHEYLTELSDLGMDCTAGYREYKNGNVRQTCRCKEVNKNE